MVFACLVGLFSLTNPSRLTADENQAVRAPRPMKAVPFHQTYIPLEGFDSLFAGGAKGVIMPRKAFLELYGKSQGTQATSKSSPRKIDVTKVTYQGRVQGDQLLVTALISFRQYSTGWQRLSLPLSRFRVEQATLNGKPALLGKAPANRESLLLLNHQKGPGAISLLLSTPLHRIGGDKVASIGLTGHPIASFQLALPAGQYLQIDNVDLKRPVANDAAANYQFAVGQRRQIQLKIHDGKSASPTDNLLLATTSAALSVTGSDASWQAETILEPVGKRRSRFEFTVSGPLKITSVTATGLQSWEWKPGEDDDSRSTVVVTFRQPFTGPRKIRLLGLRSIIPGEFWSVPNLALNGVDSHVGRLVITHSAELRLRRDEYDGVFPSTTSAGRGKPNRANSPRVMEFRVWREDFNLSMFASLRENRVTAQAMTTLRIEDSGVPLEYVAEITGRPRNLRIAIPSEWSIGSITVNGQPAKWTSPSLQVNSRHVWIQLSDVLKSTSKTQVILRARRTLEFADDAQKTAEFAIPEIRLTSADTLSGAIAILADSQFEVIPDSLKGVESTQFNLTGEKFAYTYTGTPQLKQWYKGNLKVVRRAAGLSVRTVTHSRLDPEALRSRIDAELTIRGGGITQIEVSLPESTGTGIRFRWFSRSGKLIEQILAKPKNGRRHWTLKFNRRLSGKGVLSVSTETSSLKNDALSLVHDLRFPTANRQTGFIAIEAREDQRLDIVATELVLIPAKDGKQLNAVRGAKLDEVDPIEIPTFSLIRARSRYVPRQRIVAVYRYLASRYRIALTEKQLTGPAVPRAICHLNEIHSVLFVTGEFQHRAEYRMATGNVQGFRIKLPENATLWSTLLNEKPVEVRKEGDHFFIGSNGSDYSTVNLKLFYRTKVDLPQGVGRVRQETPEVFIVEGAGSVRPLEILERTWTLHTAPETLVVGSAGLFHAVNPHDNSSLLNDVLQQFTLEAGNGFQFRLTSLLILGGLLVLALVAFKQAGAKGLAITGGIVGMIILALVIPMFLISSSQDPDTAAYYSGAGDKSEGEYFDPPSARGYESAAKSASGRPPGFEVLAGEKTGSAPSKSKGEFKRPGRFTPPASPANEKPSKGKRSQGREPTGKPMGGKPKSGRPRNGKDGGEGKKIVNQPQTETPTKSTGKNEKSNPKSDPQSGSGTARFSVAINFQAPSQHVSRTFRYRGSQTSLPDTDSSDNPEPLRLDVIVENQSDGIMLRLTVALGVLLAFWWLRALNLRIRGCMAAIGLALPAALVTIAPVVWHASLDGIFLGTACGTLLWFIRYAVAKRHECIAKVKKGIPVFQKAFNSSLLLLGMSFAATQCSQTAIAAPPKPKFQAIPAGTIVVPYDSTKDPSNADRVFVPYAEFSRLWELAHPNAILPTSPGVEGMVLQAVHAGEVQPATKTRGEVLAVKSRILFYSFLNRQIIMPVPIGQVSMQTAKLNGQSAPLLLRAVGATGKRRVANSAKQFHIPLAKSGMHILDLEYEIPVKKIGSGGQLTIPLKPVATGKFTILLSSGKFQVALNGQTGVFRRQTLNNRDSLDFAIDQGSNVVVNWQLAEEKKQTTNIVHATIKTNVSLDDRGLRRTSEFTLDVRRGQIIESQFTIPTSLKLARITGAEIAGWESKRMGEQHQVRLFFRNPISKKTQITFSLFQPFSFTSEETELEISPVAMGNVVHQTETVRVIAEPDLKVRVTSQADYSQIENLKAGKSRQFQQSWRSSNTTRKLELNVTRPLAETSLIAQHAVLIGRRNLQYSSQFAFDMQGSFQDTIALLLPENFKLKSVTGSLVSGWSMGEEGTIFIELKSPQAGKVSLFVTGTIAGGLPTGKATLAVPAPVLVSKMTNHVGIWLDPDLSATIENRADWLPVLPGRLPRQLQQLKTQPARFGFRSENTELESIELKLTPRQPSVLAEAITFITVTDLAVHQTLVMKWSGLNGSVSSVAFTTPAWLGDQLDFRVSSQLRVRRDTAAQLPNGRVRWIAQAAGSRNKNLVLVATATLAAPRTAGNRVRAAVLTLETGSTQGETVTFNSVPRQNQVAVVANHSTQKLEAEDPKSLVSVSLKELPRTILLTTDLAQLANQAVNRVRLSPESKEPVWRLRTFRLRRSARAAVNRVELVTVVERDGTWRCRAIYHVKNRSQQFLALQLPEKSRVLSVVVKGRASRIVTFKPKETVYSLIPLPKAGEAELAFPVKIILTGVLPNGPLPRGLKLRATAIDLPVPHVVSPKQDSRLGIPVAHTHWTVHLPADYNIEADTKSDSTNVTVTDEQKEAEYLELKNLRAANELFNVMSSSESGSKKKFQAWQNLQKFEATRKTGYSDNAELQAEQEKYLDQKKQLRSQFKVDSGKQSLVTRGDNSLKALNEQQQRATVQKQALSILRGNTGIPIRMNSADFFNQNDSNKNQQGQSSQGGQSGESFSKLAGISARLDSLTGVHEDRLDSVSPPTGSSPGLPTTKFPAAKITDGTNSIDFDLRIPESGQVLIFTKPGGEPKLRLTVRPQQTLNSAMKFVWSAVWILVGIVFVAALWKTGLGNKLRRQAFILMAISGAFIVILFPASLIFLGYLLFTVGLIGGTLNLLSGRLKASN